MPIAAPPPPPKQSRSEPYPPPPAPPKRCEHCKALPQVALVPYCRRPNKPPVDLCEVCSSLKSIWWSYGESAASWTDEQRSAISASLYATQIMIKAEYNFAVFLQQGGPLVEAILKEAVRVGKAPHDTFLYRSADFLSNPAHKADRDSAVLDLYKALVARSKGGRFFDSDMQPSLKAKTLAAALNVNVISPKAGRTLRVVLDDLSPSQSVIKRAKRQEIRTPAMKDPLSVEQVKAKPPSTQDLVAKAKLTLFIPQNSTQHVNEITNTSLRGSFIRESVGLGANQLAALPNEAITRGCIVLHLGTSDFYHVDTMSSKYGEKWLRSEADTTKDGDMRLWCRKLMLVDANPFRGQGSEVRCVFSFVHDGVVRIDADNAYAISSPPHKYLVLHQEEKYRISFAAPSVAQDRDAVYLYTFALMKLERHLDVTQLQGTGEALSRGLLACAPSSVSALFRTKIRGIAAAWKMEVAKECVTRFS